MLALRQEIGNAGDSEQVHAAAQPAAVVDEGGQGQIPAIRSADDGNARRIEIGLRGNPVEERADVAHGVLAVAPVVQRRKRLAEPGRSTHVRLQHGNPQPSKRRVPRVRYRQLLFDRTAVQVDHHRPRRFELDRRRLHDHVDHARPAADGIECRVVDRHRGRERGAGRRGPLRPEREAAGRHVEYVDAPAPIGPEHDLCHLRGRRIGRSRTDVAIGRRQRPPGSGPSVQRIQPGDPGVVHDHEQRIGAAE